MSQPPPRLRVGPHNFFVYPDDQLVNDEKLGLSDYDRNSLSYQPDLPLSQEQEVMIHEALHLVVVQTGLRDEWGIEYEEGVIARLSPLLLQVVKDNPGLIEYLQQAS